MGDDAYINVAIDDVVSVRGCGCAIHDVLNQRQLSGNGKSYHVEHGSLEMPPASKKCGNDLVILRKFTAHSSTGIEKVIANCCANRMLSNVIG
jgi:hypothetical protein